MQPNKSTRAAGVAHHADCTEQRTGCGSESAARGAIPASAACADPSRLAQVGANPTRSHLLETHDESLARCAQDALAITDIRTALAALRACRERMEASRTRKR